VKVENAVHDPITITGLPRFVNGSAFETDLRKMKLFKQFAPMPAKET
jgi:hypothetical protein